MQTSRSTDNFFDDNKKLVKDYLDIRFRILQLRGIRFFAKTAGNFIWLLVLLFLVFLLMIFIGLTAGFYLSSVAGSYMAGFGLTTLIILLFILLLVVFRQQLFINTVIRRVIKSSGSDKSAPEQTGKQ